MSDNTTCPICWQDMRIPPKKGLTDCPRCGQGIAGGRLLAMFKAKRKRVVLCERGFPQGL